MSETIPIGETVFLDANILCYHFVHLPGLETESAACTELVNRIACGELTGITSVLCVGECRHKMMLVEASQRFGGNVANAYFLRKHKDWIRSLKDHLDISSDLSDIGIRIEPLTKVLLDDVGTVIRETGLLNNDASTVALLRRQGITWLATNDDDFNDIAGLRVWKPR